MPKISIIVPVYNVEEHLNKCVESILTQTYTDFELILINDGSTDNSGSICDRFANIDSRIVVIHQPNKGVSATRNSGIEIAKGTYLTFVDSDDYVSEDFLLNLIEKKCDLAIASIETISSDGEHLWNDTNNNTIWNTKSDINYLSLFKTRILHSAWGKLFLKSIIIEHNIVFTENISWGEDSMFVFEYIKFCNSIALFENLDYHYVRYPQENTLSTKIRKDIIDMYTISREYCAKIACELCPQKQAEINNIFTNSLNWLCIDTLQKTINSKTLSKHEKIELLSFFSKNKYVINIYSNPTAFLPPNDPYTKAFQQKEPKKMLRKYTFLIFKNKIKKSLYSLYRKIFR